MPNLNVHAEGDVVQGRYANIVSVTAQERDVAIDFISMIGTGPSEAQGQLVARIFLNRFTAKELSQLIQAAEQNWEKRRFESTQIPPSPEAAS